MKSCLKVLLKINRLKKLEAVLYTLKEILAAGDAAAVVRLAALGLEHSARAAGPSFNPNDEMATIASQFLSLHRRACEAAKPDPHAEERS